MIKPFQGNLKVIVEAKLNPSEDLEKVKKAIANVLCKEVYEKATIEDDLIKYESNSYLCLSKIYEQIRHRRTMAVLRRLLKRNATRNETWVYLNRQAAFVGKVVICEEEQESPLGPIVIKFITDDIESFIEWITPLEETRRG